uniref:Uncharacterized protein n=1 Tax=Phenylobacterium glaciei TaxID=2803784 RepID=A0A974P182_9CAUL|nr:hypothetical protein JKL49_17870 [Phenylobacterium glaciei]
MRIGSDGRPVLSAELMLVVDGIKKSTGTKANMPLRGIGPNGLLVRRQARIREGECSRQAPTRSWWARDFCGSSRGSRWARR